MLELNQLYLGDCLEVMRDIYDNSIDMILTSPPYDSLRVKDSEKFKFEGIPSECYRVLSDGGVLVWIVGDSVIKGSESGTSFKQALDFMDHKFKLHDTMIYEKDSISFPERNRYYQIFEYMFIFSKGKPKTVNLIKDRRNIWFNGRKHIKGHYRDSKGAIKRHNKQNLLNKYGVRYNIWRIPGGCNKSTIDKEAFKHPAIFPEKLAKDHILSWSKEGDIVLDIMCGSGTTCKMAAINNRKWIGIDISEEYIEIAKKRLDLLKC